jgi:predicted O-methyltransferase YrrM
MIEFVRSLLFSHPALGHAASMSVPAIPHLLQSVLPANQNVYEITRELGALLASLVLQGGRRRVLEFGAGASSRVHAAALAEVGGGMLTSVENDPAWCSKVWSEVQQFAGRGVDACMAAAPVRFMIGGWGVGYAQPAALREVSRRAPYDLVLIDAPGGNYGRLGTFPLVARFLQPGATIVVDDARTPSARWVLASWLRRYPGLELEVDDPGFGRRGVAILRWHGGGTRWSARAWLGGCYHAASRWRRRRGIV